MRNPYTVFMLAASMQGGEPGAIGEQVVEARPTGTIVEALLAAFEDERRAEAFYAAVMERHGAVRPFSNIIHAERRHQAMLVPLLERYGVAVPDGPVLVPDVPDSLRACCEAGIRAEEENIALFDALIPTIGDEAVRSAFERLRWASRERHLIAFRRCAEGGGGRHRGQGGRGPSRE
jgi:rubrerythrin